MKNAGLLAIVMLAAVVCSGCVMSAADRADLIQRAGELAGAQAAALAEKAAKAIIEKAIDEASKKAIAAGLSPEETAKLALLAREAAEGTAAKLIEDARAKAETAARDVAARSTRDTEDGKANIFGKILTAVLGLVGAGGMLAAKSTTGGAV